MDRNICGSDCGDKLCGSVASGDKLGKKDRSSVGNLQERGC